MRGPTAYIIYKFKNLVSSVVPVHGEKCTPFVGQALVAIILVGKLKCTKLSTNSLKIRLGKKIIIIILLYLKPKPFPFT